MGTPVLLLPGGAEAVEGFFPGLSEGIQADPGCRVIVYDRAGTGTDQRDAALAQAPDELHALIHEAAAGPVVVIGQSLGGAVAALLAQRHPEDIAGIVMLDPTPINDAAAARKVERLFRLLGAACRVGWIRRSFAASQRREVARMVAEHAMSEECRAAAEKTADADIGRLARSVHGLEEVARTFDSSSLPREVPAVLVTADRKPSHFMRRAHDSLASAFGTTPVMWERSVHAVHLTHPAEVLEVCRGVLREVAGSRDDGHGIA